MRREAIGLAMICAHGSKHLDGSDTDRNTNQNIPQFQDYGGVWCEVLREDFGTDGLAFSAGVPHQLFFTLLKLHAVAHDLGLGFRVQGFRVRGLGFMV